MAVSDTKNQPNISSSFLFFSNPEKTKGVFETYYNIKGEETTPFYEEFTLAPNFADLGQADLYNACSNYQIFDENKQEEIVTEDNYRTVTSYCQKCYDVLEEFDRVGKENPTWNQIVNLRRQQGRQKRRRSIAAMVGLTPREKQRIKRNRRKAPLIQIKKEKYKRVALLFGHWYDVTEELAGLAYNMICAPEQSHVEFMEQNNNYLFLQYETKSNKVANFLKHVSNLHETIVALVQPLQKFFGNLKWNNNDIDFVDWNSQLPSWRFQQDILTFFYWTNEKNQFSLPPKDISLSSLPDTLNTLFNSETHSLSDLVLNEEKKNQVQFVTKAEVGKNNKQETDEDIWIYIYYEPENETLHWRHNDEDSVWKKAVKRGFIDVIESQVDKDFGVATYPNLTLIFFIYCYIIPSAEDLVEVIQIVEQKVTETKTKTTFVWGGMKRFASFLKNDLKIPYVEEDKKEQLPPLPPLGPIDGGERPNPTLDNLQVSLENQLRDNNLEGKSDQIKISDLTRDGLESLGINLNLCKVNEIEIIGETAIKSLRELLDAKRTGATTEAHYLIHRDSKDKKTRAFVVYDFFNLLIARKTKKVWLQKINTEVKNLDESILIPEIAKQMIDNKKWTPFVPEKSLTAEINWWCADRTKRRSYFGTRILLDVIFRIIQKFKNSAKKEQNLYIFMTPSPEFDSKKQTIIDNFKNWLRILSKLNFAFYQLAKKTVGKNNKVVSQDPLFILHILRPANNEFLFPEYDNALVSII